VSHSEGKAGGLKTGNRSKRFGALRADFSFAISHLPFSIERKRRRFETVLKADTEFE
jgi:hypothetical protein